jgi:uncharacterized protein (DUF736 family)
MPDYDNNMRGVLFKNDKKETDKHPDYKGSCEVNGEEMWLSAWIQTSKAGQKYMSLQFEPKDVPRQAQSGQQAAAPAAAPVQGGLADDDIPF